MIDFRRVFIFLVCQLFRISLLIPGSQCPSPSFPVIMNLFSYKRASIVPWL